MLTVKQLLWNISRLAQLDVWNSMIPKHIVLTIGASFVKFWDNFDEIYLHILEMSCAKCLKKSDEWSQTSHFCFHLKLILGLVRWVIICTDAVQIYRKTTQRLIHRSSYSKCLFFVVHLIKKNSHRVCQTSGTGTFGGKDFISLIDSLFDLFLCFITFTGSLLFLQFS